MRESELVNHLSSIQDSISNLGNDCKNIKFVCYIGKLIFHSPITLKSCISNVRRKTRDFRYSAHYGLKIYLGVLVNRCNFGLGWLL